MGTYKIVSHSGSGLPLNVYGSGTISGRRNVCLWTDTGSSDQRWSITNLGSNQVVCSMNNTSYALNAYRTDWNCDVYTVNTDSYVNFLSVGNGIYRIQLNSDTTKYLTAEGSSSNSNVKWSVLDASSNAQKWEITQVTTTSTSGGSKILSMPSGPRCNWNQKHSGVTQYFGNSACTLVAGLDASNFYATDGVGYTPSSMNSSSYWISGVGYTWKIPGPGKIGTKQEFTTSTQSAALAYIKEQIDAGCPVLISIGTSSSASHTVFGYGYKNGASEYSDIYVYDPANTDTSDISGRAVDLNNAMDYNHDYFNIRNVYPTSRS